MGKSGLILMLVAALAARAVALPSAATVEQILAALDRGDAQQAWSLSNAALKQKTGDAHTRACLLLYHGMAMELLGAHDTAMRDLTEAIDSHALSADEQGQALLQRGFLRESQGRLVEAIGDYGVVIDLKGYSAATAFNHRAGIYVRGGRLLEAQQDYLAALAADGGQAQYSYFGLGQIAEIKGDRLAARGFYSKAVAVDAAYAAAAERLSALGGRPDAASADPAARIVLRPPVRSGTVADRDTPVVLHPPPDERDESTAGLPAVPPTTPFRPVIALTLRPALDQSDRRVSPNHASQVQLGAWRSAAEAYAAWDKVKARAGDVLDGSSVQILAADVPGRGRYFRLRVRPGLGQSGAEICVRLAAKALDCFPVRD